MSTSERLTAVGAVISATPAASASELGVVLGVNRDVMIGFLGRHRSKLPNWQGQPVLSAWTEETEAVLRDEWKHGATANAIARKLGSSASTVLRKAEALGLPPRSVEARRQEAVASAKRAIAARGVGWKPMAFGTPLSPVPTLPRDVNAKAFEPLPGATPPKALHLLERHECHWPVGEGFCGCYAETGRYCATHTRMSGKMVPRLVIA